MCVSIVCPPTSKNEPDIWHQQFKKMIFHSQGKFIYFSRIIFAPNYSHWEQHNSGVTIFWILDDNYYTEQTT